MMSRRHKKFFRICVFRSRKERRKEKDDKKNSSEFVFFGQASSRRCCATKSTFQSGSLRSPFVHPLEPSSGCIPLGAHARLPSACAFVRSSRSPPTRRGPR